MKIWSTIICCAIYTFLGAQQDDFFHPDLRDLLETGFPFGVASGDPTNESVVLWTKVVTDTKEPVKVSWLIAIDSSLQNVEHSGELTTAAGNAYTVKVNVQNLTAGKTWYYQFICRGKKSPIGRTKTAPDDTDLLRLAVVSCSDFQTGHFNAYRHIASRHDLDAVLHLGDYIYETSAKRWGPKKQRKRMYREHLPAHLLRSLQDYRTRYGQYRLDPYLQEAHRLHPFITVWDDHEFANNVSSENNGERQSNRVGAARQAYFEWLPVADNPELNIYRSFQFGGLADLWMIDTRMAGRTAQAEGEDDPSWLDESRMMLGEKQMKWLTDGMGNSTARWKIIGNQVIFSRLHDSRVFSRVPAIKMERWDGYPAAQERLFDFWKKQDINNIIVLTGDVHTGWAFELTPSPLDSDNYDPATGQGVIGAEFITPSISSFNMNDILPRPLAWESERRFKKNKYNPHLRYLDLVRHGYLTLTLDKDKASSTWYFFNPRYSTTRIQQQRTWTYDLDKRKLVREK